MIANHIHDALGQVRRLQILILEKRRFTGYSGTARILGGMIAGLGCSVMTICREDLQVQLTGWCCILALALMLNYGAVLLWFIQLPARQRNAVSISPAYDALPPLAIGALLSIALVLKSQYDLLFGTWMCLYGLAHTVYRTSLPRSIWLVGLYYMVCGTFFLIWPGISFMNPLPAGLVFLGGEWAGGTIFHRHKIEAIRDSDDE